MIVLDASAAVDWLLQTSAGQSIDKRIGSGNETLHAPHLLDLKVTQLLSV
jgi:predicted nucleic acid-binding protein